MTRNNTPTKSAGFHFGEVQCSHVKVQWSLNTTIHSDIFPPPISRIYSAAIIPSINRFTRESIPILEGYSHLCLWTCENIANLKRTTFNIIVIEKFSRF